MNDLRQGHDPQLLNKSFSKLQYHVQYTINLNITIITHLISQILLSQAVSSFKSSNFLSCLFLMSCSTPVLLRFKAFSRSDI